jgi:hypothetical protein
MNVKAVTEDIFPNMRLPKNKLKRWLRDTKGKELRKSSKPYLTKEQKEACIR